MHLKGRTAGDVAGFLKAGGEALAKGDFSGALDQYNKACGVSLP